MVAKPSGPIMEISQSTLQGLNGELRDTLKLEVPENGLRNSYASYGFLVPIFTGNFPGFRAYNDASPSAKA